LRKYLWLPLLAALAVSLLAFAACSDDDDDGSSETSPTASPEEIAAVEQLAKDLVEGDPTDQADVDFFFAHVTDDVLESFFQTTREECMAEPVDCIGEPSAVESVDNTTVSGSDASTDVTADFGAFTFVLIKDGEVWKLTQLKAISPDIPAGVTVVDLELNEFAFGFNRSDIEDGNFAFASENIGEQNHEVIVIKLDGVTLDEALAFEGDGDPPGVTTMAFVAPVTPGDQVNVVFEEPLEPGNYALICFFPDTSSEEEKAHVELGMKAEFEVPAE